MSGIMRRFHKGKTFGNKTLKLVKPSEYTAKRLMAKTWHNPYTEKDEVRKELLSQKFRKSGARIL
jgi:hypothetical protein